MGQVKDPSEASLMVIDSSSMVDFEIKEYLLLMDFNWIVFNFWAQTII